MRSVPAVPVSTFMVPRMRLCTGAVLVDGLPRFASLVLFLQHTREQRNALFSTGHEPSINIILLFSHLSHGYLSRTFVVQKIMLCTTFWYYVETVTEGVMFLGKEIKEGSTWNRVVFSGSTLLDINILIWKLMFWSRRPIVGWKN